MYILNTKVLDRDYTTLDVPLATFKSINEYKLTGEFYGGNVTHIADVNGAPIKLLLNNNDDHMKVVDIAVDDLADIDTMSLKKYAKERGIEFNWKCSKDELVDLLKEKLLQV